MGALEEHQTIELTVFHSLPYRHYSPRLCNIKTRRTRTVPRQNAFQHQTHPRLGDQDPRSARWNAMGRLRCLSAQVCPLSSFNGRQTAHVLESSSFVLNVYVLLIREYI